MKVGEKITIDDLLQKRAVTANAAINCEIGDEAYVDCLGLIHYTTGRSKGKVQKLNLEKPRGYDYNNISECLTAALMNQSKPFSDMTPHEIKNILFNALFHIL